MSIRDIVIFLVGLLASKAIEDNLPNLHISNIIRGTKTFYSRFKTYLILALIPIAVKFKLPPKEVEKVIAVSVLIALITTITIELIKLDKRSVTTKKID